MMLLIIAVKRRLLKCYPLLCIVFFMIAVMGPSGSAWGKTVLLWEVDGEGIYGLLPSNWQPMTAEELKAFPREGGEKLQESGYVVAGFQLKQGNDPRQGPYVLVLAKPGIHVPREQIHKTFDWFQKNKELLTGIFQSHNAGVPINNTTIENIEYLPDRATILFQSRVTLADHVYISVTGIVFLKNSYISIACSAPDRDFADFKEDFYSLILSVAVPEQLRHEIASPTSPPLVYYRVSYWLVNNWQKVLGATILLSLYGVMFFRKEKK